MLNDWVGDIADMHDHYEVRDKVEQFDAEKLRKFLEFRVKFLEEEMTELKVEASVLRTNLLLSQEKVPLMMVTDRVDF